MNGLDDITSDRQFIRHQASLEAGYNLSFTAASLRSELARIVAETYLMVGDWSLVKERILSTNALQCRSASSAVRMESEMRQRLETLTRDQLTFLAHATAEDRNAIAWLSVCKRTLFAFEFAAEVLRDKLAAHDLILRPSDYETYVEHKSLAHPELSRLTPSSKYKIRQVLLKMLTEVGMLVSVRDGTIQRPALSPSVVGLIAADNPRWLAAFLVPDLEISHRRPS